MSTTGQDLTQTARWWMRIPMFDDNAALERWSDEFAPLIAADQECADDPELVAFIAAVLRVVADIPYQPNFPYRMLCMPDVRRGHVVFDIGAVLVEPTEQSLSGTHRRLLGADDFGGNRGTQIEPIYGDSDEEIIGLQVVRFDLAEPEETADGDLPEQPLEAYFSCVIRRADAPNGPVDLIAIGATTEIELLLEAAIPLHLVLLSDAVFDIP